MNSARSLSQRLRAERQRLGFRLEKVAADLKLDKTTISRHETGAREVDPGQLERYARYYRVSADYLLGLTDRRTPDLAEAPGAFMAAGPMVKVPVLGSIRAGAPMFADANIIDWEVTPAEDVRNGEFFYLRVEGDSMTPDGILDGSLVLVRCQETVEQNDIAVVITCDGEAQVKHVRRLDGQVMIYSSNPAYSPSFYSEQDIRILGRVMEAKRKF